jgi:RHS repeat-associated protein
LRIDYWWTGTNWYPTGGNEYIYDGTRVIQERNNSNVPLVSYTRGTDLSGTIEGAGGISGLLARSSGYSSGNWTTHHFYHADGSGNITYLVDSSQAMAAAYRYDPFGNLISSSGSMAATNHLRYSSKEVDLNSGMYIYLYRFYDPALQRWLNRDPMEEDGGINLYEFCHNSPGDYADPDGQDISTTWPIFASGVGTGVAVGAGGALAIGGAAGLALGAGAYYLDHAYPPASKAPPEGLSTVNAPSAFFCRVQKVSPVPGAAPHTGFKRNPSGKITGYTEFDANGNPVKRFRGEGKPHGGQEPPFILVPRPGKGPGSPPVVPRPPTPGETPPGY